MLLATLVADLREDAGGRQGQQQVLPQEEHRRLGQGQGHVQELERPVRRQGRSPHDLLHRQEDLGQDQGCPRFAEVHCVLHWSCPH
ncbi:hypothetical protein TL16_g00665 [Triparma laevis f. inornata]|uniref:Uncharacterized protein n=1 Tax=Triparma laevis f. inornata TaxID=1714386 RepID=A0A9W6ZCT6_9STRA|nr:hypothetical protein TL16_g00665 [Triparma laevis f. inornata]